MKKILFCMVTVFSIFIIYLATMDRKVYYLALGNSSKRYNNNYGYSYFVSQYINKKDVLEDYVYDYSDFDKKIPDLIKDIQNNAKSRKYTLKNCLVKADLVTLRISHDDVLERIMFESSEDVYDYIDGLCKDFEKLIKLIREYCKEDVLFLGYLISDDYTSEGKDIIEYLNKRYKSICDDYNVTFVDIRSSDEKDIFKQVIKIVDKKMFEG